MNRKRPRGRKRGAAVTETEITVTVTASGEGMKKKERKLAIFLHMSKRMLTFAAISNITRGAESNGRYTMGRPDLYGAATIENNN